MATMFAKRPKPETDSLATQLAAVREAETAIAQSVADQERRTLEITRLRDRAAAATANPEPTGALQRMLSGLPIVVASEPSESALQQEIKANAAEIVVAKKEYAELLARASADYIASIRPRHRELCEQLVDAIEAAQTKLAAVMAIPAATPAPLRAAPCDFPFPQGVAAHFWHLLTNLNVSEIRRTTFSPPPAPSRNPKTQHRASQAHAALGMTTGRLAICHRRVLCRDRPCC